MALMSIVSLKTIKLNLWTFTVWCWPVIGDLNLITPYPFCLGVLFHIMHWWLGVESHFEKQIYYLILFNRNPPFWPVFFQNKFESEADTGRNNIFRIKRRAYDTIIEQSGSNHIIMCEKKKCLMVFFSFLF